MNALERVWQRLWSYYKDNFTDKGTPPSPTQPGTSGAAPEVVAREVPGDRERREGRS